MKNKWTTEKILQIVREKRTVKNDPDKYKDIQKCVNKGNT